jgi:hypothetical protein
MNLLLSAVSCAMPPFFESPVTGCKPAPRRRVVSRTRRQRVGSLDARPLGRDQPSAWHVTDPKSRCAKSHQCPRAEIRSCCCANQSYSRLTHHRSRLRLHEWSHNDSPPPRVGTERETAWEEVERGARHACAPSPALSSPVTEASLCSAARSSESPVGCSAVSDSCTRDSAMLSSACGGARNAANGRACAT